MTVTIFHNVIVGQTYRETFDKFDYLINDGQGFAYYINQDQTLHSQEPVFLKSYLIMYEKTNELKYLDKAIININRVQERRDDAISYSINPIFYPQTACNSITAIPYNPYSKGWSTAIDNGPACSVASWVQRVLHSGDLIYPMSQLVYLIKVDHTELQNNPLPTEVSGTTIDGYGINTYLDFANWLEIRVNQTIQYHNLNWCANIGLYERGLNGWQCGSGAGSSPDAINMQCAMGRSLIMMHLVESLPGGNSTYANDYLYKANLIAYQLRQIIDAYPQNNFYSWCHTYNCEFIEDIQHAYLVMEFADLCYKYNVSGYFSLNDMTLFSNTFAKSMYNAPLQFSLNTYGSNNDVQDGLGTAEDNRGRISLYTFLCEYNPQIYQIISDYYSGIATTNNPTPFLFDLLGTAYLTKFENVFNPIH